MIKLFLNFLEEKSIAYKVTNSYDEITTPTRKDADFDIIFRKKDFYNIEKIVRSFSNANDFVLVQIYHQGRYAKNFFVYDGKSNTVLNLDLYGELSRQGIKILDEEDIFNVDIKYKEISILKPEQEFIQYLIKKIDKGSILKNEFLKLKKLFDHHTRKCSECLSSFFKNTSIKLVLIFQDGDYDTLVLNLNDFKEDFSTNPKTAKEPIHLRLRRIAKRLLRPTGITIAFLGPDGSGKSTIIDLLQERILPFRRIDYFHLKPIPQDALKKAQIVSDPHSRKPYAPLKSYIKLVYFLYQYNTGWLNNIALLKRKSSLIIFDRYFDDMLVDHKRYRYGAHIGVARFIRRLIPKPELYFVLTANSEVIANRKKEVTEKELKRQVNGYRCLVDQERYIGVDVTKKPQLIVDEVFKVLMKKMNERY